MKLIPEKFRRPWASVLLAAGVAAVGLLGGAPYAAATGATIDLGNNMLVLSATDYTTQEANYAQVLGLVSSGFNSGYWNGPGINSSVAAQDFISGDQILGVDVVDNSNFGLSSVHGYNLNSSGNQVIAAAGIIGDLDLSGAVDTLDYQAEDYYYSAQDLAGDLNHDGAVDTLDYQILDACYAYQGDYNTNTLAYLSIPASMSAGLGVSVATASDQVSGSPSAVPEPGTVGFLLAGLVGILGHRRKIKNA